MVIAALLVALAFLVWPGPAPDAAVNRLADDGRGGGRGATGPTTWVRAANALLRRRSRRSMPWVADFAEVVAVGLEAGLDLGSAAVASARSPGVAEQAPWLHHQVLVCVAGGHGVARSLDPPQDLPPGEVRDLALLAAAWRLAAEAGAGARDVTAAAADAVRSRRATDERAAALAAGPRASMWLLTALPLAGPLAGVAVGVGPDRLYGTPAGRAAAAAGLLLTAAGWWWSHTLLSRARRPGLTAGASR